MAQYKVPQDVEADDKLLGPFSFRQFVYLLIAGGLVALAVLLFQLFPLLAIIPLPFIILMVVLALPLKKDQPMETYLAALVSYYLKPHTRLWTPGQRDSIIKITAPKIIEEKRTRDISGEEANHRLSFLADIVDTGGYSIKGMGANSTMREELVAEASTAVDMFEDHHFEDLNSIIQKDETRRHEEAVQGMKDAIDAAHNVSFSNAKVQKRFEELKPSPGITQMRPVASSQPQATIPKPSDKYASPVVVRPGLPDILTEEPASAQNSAPTAPKPSIIELANNTDYSVETIAKEAKRINEREGEVFISLH